MPPKLLSTDAVAVEQYRQARRQASDSLPLEFQPESDTILAPQVVSAVTAAVE